MLASHPASAANSKPVVLELYTSQGCSSCPPADVLLRALAAADTSLLPLSFHVHYWDNLGWRDPYSSTANTERQQAYRQSLGEPNIYTPQLVVDGTTSVVGSRSGAVKDAISTAKQKTAIADVSLTSASQPDQLTAIITRHAGAAAVANTEVWAEVWEVRFNRQSETSVSAGENAGHRLNSINNVLSLKKLGDAHNLAVTFTIDKPAKADEGIAILVQQPNHGVILGAAAL